MSLTVYGMGLDTASVCTDLPEGEVVDAMNQDQRDELEKAGVGHIKGLPWFFSTDIFFGQGQPNPCPCEKNPDTHKHYLMHC